VRLPRKIIPTYNAGIDANLRLIQIQKATAARKENSQKSNQFRQLPPTRVTKTKLKLHPQKDLTQKVTQQQYGPQQQQH
jgi:hypothetical protein